MTWFPEKGNNSVQNFDSSVGAVFQNSDLQEIADGFVTLKSIRSGTVGYIDYWNNNISWTIQNGLADVQEAQTDFDILTGAADPASGNTTTGFAGVSTQASAWYFQSSLPAISGGVYTGRGHYALYMSSGGPNTALSDSFSNSSLATTFEFDVACLEDYYVSGNYGIGSASLSGFSQSGTNLSGLPALSGILSHGLLFSDGNYWDFIEVTTEGIRSTNHPEIALPIDLQSPRKIRVGFRDNDIFISTSDGTSVAGYSKFDTAVSSPTSGFALFGAPSVDGPYAESGIAENIDASYGRSYWDNIKILTGDMAIFNSTGIEQLYTTTPVFVNTPVFDPGIGMSQFNYANIGYVPLEGGETTVTVQYFNKVTLATVDFATVTLTSDSTVQQIDLTNLPVFTTPDTNNYINPITFKITQRSLSGNCLAPPVDYIEVFATSSNFNIDLLPEWKHVNSKTKVKFYPEVSSFYSYPTRPEVFSQLLLNVTEATGVVTGYLDDQITSNNFDIVGTGEVITSGPFNKSFKNFVDVSRVAESGSEAANYFGIQPTVNFFPNPLFSEGFRPVASGEPNFYTGKTQGEIAANFYIPDVYTGNANVTYSSVELYRPEAQATQARINTYLGVTTTPFQEFAQAVELLNLSGYDGTDGIQAQVPSGIATGNLKVSFDLQIEKGHSLDLVISGTSTSSYYLPGETFRDFRPVSFTTVNDSNNSVDISLLVSSGNTGEEYSFNIDNFTVTALETSYLSQTGINAYLHVDNEAIVGGYTAETIFNTSLYLYSYPETEGTLFNITGENGRGLDIAINSEGYPVVTVDGRVATWSLSPGVVYTHAAVPPQSFTGSTRVPLGKWTTLGFIHDVHAFEDKQGASFYPVLTNFASTNKLTIAIDGHISASKDFASDWRAWRAAFLQGNPYVSYIDLSGDCTSVIASGLLCEVDSTHFARPPVSDVESELSIKGARAYPPYFIPDQLYKANDESSNLLLTGLDTNEPDLYIGSCYNFSSLGYANWDRGPLKNHLVISGAYSTEENSPYNDNLVSTRFYSGSKAVATYSSSYERLVNSTGQLEFAENKPYGEGAIQAFGWIYPRETGEFISIVQEYTAPSNNKLSLAINSESGLLFTKYDSAGSVAFTVTGQDIELDSWNFIKFRFDSPDHLNDTDSTQAITYLADNLGNAISVTGTGPDYGFRYQTGTEGSAVIFGGGPDVSFFNWALPIAHTGDDFTRTGLDTTGSKGGRYQAVLKDTSLFTGQVTFTGFRNGEMLLGIGATGEDYYFGCAMHDSYDSFPSLQGIVAFDNKAFKEVNDYSYRYDSSSIDQTFGTNLSPIRVGNGVPEVGINIARYSAPAFSVNSSIASIDLSDKNINNIVTYRNGDYDVSESDFVTGSVLTGYKGINSGIYDSSADVTFSGKVVSSDIEITTLPITDLASETYDKAFYYYLVGRGERAVKILDAVNHFTGNLTSSTTGELADAYLANLEKVKSSITIKNRNGDVISKEAYPYDVCISPYTPDYLLSAVNNGIDVFLDNIGTSFSGTTLPDSYFSVILVTSKNRLPGSSVFVHYDAYDLASNQDEGFVKEIVNPQPIFRKKQSFESASAGYFDVSLNEDKYYNLTFYGLDGTYSGVV